MIKVDLVTGFLGAGKTTFIKSYVPLLLKSGEKVGILENDFGAINVDVILLGALRGENCEIEMIAGGCDSDCYRRRFKTKLISMAMSGYTRVVMEPSGIFDINDFYDILREEPLDNWYEIGNVFCVTDAGMDTEMSKEAEYILKTQIANAGCVVLSRIAEVPESKCKETKEYITRLLCKPVTFFEKDFKELNREDLRLLDRSGFQIKEFVKEFDFDNLEFETLTFLEHGLTAEKIKTAADILFHMTEEEVGHITRIKGFAKKSIPTYDNESWESVNATRHEVRVHDTEAGQEVLIVIGERLNKRAISKILGINDGI